MYGSEDRQAWLTEFLDEVGIQWVIGIHMYAYIPCGTYDYVHFGCIATYIRYVYMQTNSHQVSCRTSRRLPFVDPQTPSMVECLLTSHPNSRPALLSSDCVEFCREDDRYTHN